MFLEKSALLIIEGALAIALTIDVLLRVAILALFRVLWNLIIVLGRFFNLALFSHFSEHGFTKCNLLSFTEFLNNLDLNKYAGIVYQRLLKALRYSDFNLSTSLRYMVIQGFEDIKCSAASLPLWRIFWI